MQGKKHLTSFQIIILGFAGVILLGALILMLPISTRENIVTPFNETLFTATSAVCVTGLVVHDTGSYWSDFGKVVIITLIQIGGLGVVTVAASLALISGRRISLIQRSAMQEAIAAPKVGGIVRLTGFVLRITFLIELIGALIMMPVFCRDYGIRGIWISVFHSISAFCNAGFDLLGTVQNPYVSITDYSDNPVISLTIALLIIVGGIGFLTWDDIRAHRLRLKNYRMQSKVILITTVILIITPTVYYYIFDFSEYAVKERILVSFFQAVTPRTAGFNSVDLTRLSSVGQSIMIILMLIGGSPGSTAGGMKATTVAVLFGNARAIFAKKESAHFFGRRIEEQAIKSAATVALIYLVLFLSGGMIISTVEGLPLGVCLFEAASAVGTVGLTLGITPNLGMVSQGVLIVLMYLGRVGGLTLVYAAMSRNSAIHSKLPQEKITIG